jgi:transcriptional regulator
MNEDDDKGRKRQEKIARILREKENNVCLIQRRRKNKSENTRGSISMLEDRI